ncbi:unnamed protein product [Camellia sinensis]
MAWKDASPNCFPAMSAQQFENEKEVLWVNAFGCGGERQECDVGQCALWVSLMQFVGNVMAQCTSLSDIWLNYAAVLIFQSLKIDKK